MKLLFALTFVLCALASSHALQCYLCVGSELTSDCANAVIESMAIQECDNRTVVEQCVSIAAVVNGMSLYERGCGYEEEGGDICQSIGGVVTELHSCYACKVDLCNV